MRGFFAIAALTIRHGLRSHLFRLLFGLLLLCAVLIPATAGDSTAAGFIQVSLLYSLAAVLGILSMSSIWLGCFVMTGDVDSYQLHMVISKPVSRGVVWLGKFAGVVAIHTVLLALSAAVVFGIVKYKFNRTDFAPEDRERAENEVLVGRRVFLPDPPDLETLTREALEERRKSMLAMGGTLPEKTPQEQEKEYRELRQEVMLLQSELLPGESKRWHFRNLPAEGKEPLFLRFRMYMGQVQTEGQRMTDGFWVARILPARARESGNLAGFLRVPLSLSAEKMRCGVFNEKKLPAEWGLVAPDGTVEISFQNMDSSSQKLFFQPSDGPKILMRVTGFGENYCRCVFVMWFWLLLLAGLGCAAGAVFSMPTAIFVVVSYLLFGSFSSFLAETSFFGNTADYIGYYAGKILLIVVIPVQKFAVAEMVADGELIEFSQIGELFAANLLLRGVPLFLFGIGMYRRREMGLVIRK